MNKQTQEVLQEKLESALNSVLFAVEQSISNGCCDWATEDAFDDYERIRKEMWELSKQNTLSNAMPELENSKDKIISLSIKG
jgi:hypothetical protein